MKIIYTMSGYRRNRLEIIPYGEFYNRDLNVTDLINMKENIVSTLMEGRKVGRQVVQGTRTLVNNLYSYYRSVKKKGPEGKPTPVEYKEELPLDQEKRLERRRKTMKLIRERRKRKRSFSVPWNMRWSLRYGYNARKSHSYKRFKRFNLW